MARPFKYLPDAMQAKVEEYKSWHKKQMFTKTVYDQKKGEPVNYEIVLPPTVQQFCLFIDISRVTYYELLNNEREVTTEYTKEINNQLSNIIAHVHEYIQDIQIKGAMLNEYNATIVSRINGLSDTVNVQSNITVNSLPVNIANNVIDLTSTDYSIIEPTPELKAIE